MKTSMLSMFGSTSKTKEFLFFFGKSEGFWAKWLKGFSHLLLAQFISDNQMVRFEPLFTDGFLDLMSFPFECNDNYTVIYVKTCPTSKQKLVKPTFQTCTTLIQYMAGIDLGCITPQGLFEALTQSNTKWLKDRGVMEVSKWESK
jgi:hypothetical protein